MARISYSQFSQWVQCPHKWKLQYIDGHRQFKGNIYTSKIEVIDRKIINKKIAKRFEKEIIIIWLLVFTNSFRLPIIQTSHDFGRIL